MIGTSSIACGTCVDSMLSHFVPFLPYWLFIFLFWSLIAGNIVAMRVKENGYEVNYPIRLFGILFLLIITLGILTGGAVVLPFALLLVFWIPRVIHAAIKHESYLWKMSLRYLLLCLGLCVVTSYFIPYAPLENYYNRYQNNKASINQFLDGSGARMISLDVNLQPRLVASSIRHDALN